MSIHACKGTFPRNPSHSSRWRLAPAKEGQNCEELGVVLGKEEEEEGSRGIKLLSRRGGRMEGGGQEKGTNFSSGITPEKKVFFSLCREALVWLASRRRKGEIPEFLPPPPNHGNSAYPVAHFGRVFVRRKRLSHTTLAGETAKEFPRKEFISQERERGKGEEGAPKEMT